MFLLLVLLVLVGIVILLMVNLQWCMKRQQQSAPQHTAVELSGVQIDVLEENTEHLRTIIQAAQAHHQVALHHANPWLAWRASERAIQQLETLQQLGYTNERVLSTTKIHLDRLLSVMRQDRDTIHQHLCQLHPDLQLSDHNDEVPAAPRLSHATISAIAAVAEATAPAPATAAAAP